jgi:hypothetical protein
VKKIKKNKIGGVCSMYGEEEEAYRLSVGKTYEKETTWKP